MDSVADASIWPLFSTSVTGPDRQQILPVCIVLHGTMLLFIVLFFRWVTLRVRSTVRSRGA